MLQQRCQTLNRALMTAMGFAALSLAIGVFAPCRAQSLAESLADKPLVRAHLVTDVAAVVPGEPFLIAVRFDMVDDWHINWRNPGDAGLAPGIEWVLPHGFAVDPLQWPFPARYVYGPLVIFGYSSGVELLAQLTPPAALAAGDSVAIVARITWLACKESCVPGESEVSLHIPVAATTPPPCSDCPAIDQRSIPTATGAWNVDAWYRDEYQIFIDLDMSGDDAPLLADVFFFPYDTGIIENAQNQELSEYGGGYRLTIERSRIMPTTPARIKGVLVAGSGWGTDAVRALEVDVPLTVR